MFQVGINYCLYFNVDDEIEALRGFGSPHKVSGLTRAKVQIEILLESKALSGIRKQPPPACGQPEKNLKGSVNVAALFQLSR